MDFKPDLQPEVVGRHHLMQRIGGLASAKHQPEGLSSMKVFWVAQHCLLTWETSSHHVWLVSSSDANCALALCRY